MGRNGTRKGRNDSVLRPSVWTSINDSQGTSIVYFILGCIYQIEGYVSLACSERSFKPFPRKIAINSHFLPRSSGKSLFMVTTNHPCPVAMNREYLRHNAEKALEVRQLVWRGVEIYHCISWKWWKSVRKHQEVLVSLNMVLIVCVCQPDSWGVSTTGGKALNGFVLSRNIDFRYEWQFHRGTNKSGGIRNLKGILGCIFVGISQQIRREIEGEDTEEYILCHCKDVGHGAGLDLAIKGVKVKKSWRRGLFLVWGAFPPCY